MGFLDLLKGKKEEKEKSSPELAFEGKYQEACALCGAMGAEKKWMGQYWHVKCVRTARKGAKKMV